jgi:hypothetical protein
MSRSLLASLLVTFSALVVACGDSTALPTHTPAAPEPTATAPADEGAGAGSSSSSSASANQVAVRVEAVCRIGPDGTGELEVRYSASAQGEVNLARVRLMVNGREADDSGPLSQKEYRRIATLRGEAGERYTYQVVVQAPGALPPNVQGSIQCPPPPTPGPRA